MKLVNKILFSSQSDEWTTPLELYNKLNKVFHFETDPCTTKDNPLGTKYFYTKEQNGLTQTWLGNVFINPPFSQIKEWVREVALRHFLTKTVGNKIVLLVPARTDTKWFHQYILGESDVELRFIKGRLKFGNAKNYAPFPSIVVIFK